METKTTFDMREQEIYLSHKYLKNLLGIKEEKRPSIF